MDLKKSIRMEVKNKLELLNDEYKLSSDKKIVNSILNLPEYQKAKTIFCFVSTDDEINTIAFIETALKHGKTVGVPKCMSLGVMNVHEIKSIQDLEVGKYNIKEPKNSCTLIKAQEIDLGIIPCCTCNENGERLGYGGGFYDRYLKDVEFVKVVICKEKLMYSDIPIDDHDVKMDIVINENKVIRI